MVVVGAQFGSQLARAAEAHGGGFDVHQHGRVGQRRQWRPVVQAAVGEDQQALALAGFQALATLLPVSRLLQGFQQRSAAAGAEVFQPLLQGSAGLVSLP
ncbi:hypothetical protein D9M70_622110 [compost metagenome]